MFVAEVASGIKFQFCIPIEQERMKFALEAWTWWHAEIRRLIDVLPGSQGPWLSKTDHYSWLIWTVGDELQLARVLRFARETEQRFGVPIYYEHHRLTFGIASEGRS